VAQRDRDVLPVWQVCKLPVDEPSDVFLLHESGHGRLRVGRLHDVDEGLFPPSRQPIEAEVECDPVKPRGEPAAARVPVPCMNPKALEDLLRNVFCVGPVAQASAGEGDDTPEVSPDEFLTGIVASRAGLERERFIGLVHNRLPGRGRAHGGPGRSARGTGWHLRVRGASLAGAQLTAQFIPGHSAVIGQLLQGCLHRWGRIQRHVAALRCRSYLLKLNGWHEGIRRPPVGLGGIFHGTQDYYAGAVVPPAPFPVKRPISLSPAHSSRNIAKSLNYLTRHLYLADQRVSLGPRDFPDLCVCSVPVSRFHRRHLTPLDTVGDRFCKEVRLLLDERYRAYSGTVYEQTFV